MLEENDPTPMFMEGGINALYPEIDDPKKDLRDILDRAYPFIAKAKQAYNDGNLPDYDYAVIQYFKIRLEGLYERM